MNTLDICITALCAVMVMLGLLRGFVRQASSLAGLVLGHVLAVRYNAWVQKLLGFDFPHAGIAAYLVALFCVYIAVRMMGLLFERWIRDSKLSGTDRFLGALTGAAKGVLLSILLVFVLVLLLPRDSALIKGSKLAPRALVAAGWLEKTFPDRIREAFREKMRTGDVHPGIGKGRKDGTETAPGVQPKKRSGK